MSTTGCAGLSSITSADSMEFFLSQARTNGCSPVTSASILAAVRALECAQAEASQTSTFQFTESGGRAIWFSPAISSAKEAVDKATKRFLESHEAVKKNRERMEELQKQMDVVGTRFRNVNLHRYAVIMDMEQNEQEAQAANRAAEEALQEFHEARKQWRQHPHRGQLTEAVCKAKQVVMMFPDKSDRAYLPATDRYSQAERLLAAAKKPATDSKIKLRAAQFAAKQAQDAVQGTREKLHDAKEVCRRVHDACAAAFVEFERAVDEMQQLEIAENKAWKCVRTSQQVLHKD